MFDWFINSPVTIEEFWWVLLFYECSIFRTIPQLPEISQKFQKRCFLKIEQWRHHFWSHHTFDDSQKTSFHLSLACLIGVFTWFIMFLIENGEATTRTLGNNEMRKFSEWKLLRKLLLWCSIFRTIPQLPEISQKFQKRCFLKIERWRHHSSSHYPCDFSVIDLFELFLETMVNFFYDSRLFLNKKRGRKARTLRNEE